VRLVSTVLLALLALGPWHRESAPDQQNQKPTFTGGVDLVTVNVVVNNRNGRPVAGLLRTDFDLLDAGEPREIAGFRSEPAGISIAVLFDISGSMSVASKLSDARDAVRHLASWLEPGSDQVALFAFDTRLLELQPFTTDPGEVVSRLGSLKPFGSTALYDAIAQTGRRLAAQGGPRRAVVVITDGVDNGSHLSARDVSAAASAIDVPVYILAIVSPLDHPGADTAIDRAPAAGRAHPLDDLARWTGGTLFIASAPAHASVAARQIVSELRQQYVMTFEPGARAGWHPLVVRTRNTDLVVRARSGYVAGPRVSGQP
jgi:Ca-activated chloride channel homolog